MDTPTNEKVEEQKEMAMVEYKENIFIRFINKLKKWIFENK